MLQNPLRRSPLAVCVIMMGLVVCSVPAVAVQYSVTDLGRLDSDPNYPAIPTAINRSGIVVGWANVKVNWLVLTYHLPHAFTWRNGTLSDIGLLPGSGDFGMSGARDINDANYIVGINMGSPPGFPFNGDTLHNHAFLWRPGIGMTDLGSMTADPNGFSGAYGINAGGHIVGSWAPSNDANIPHAFLRWSNGVVTHLGALGGSQSFAWDINDSNQVVGKAQTAGGQVRAFLWQNGAMTNLGVLPGFEASSEAFAINASGQVVGLSASSSGVGHAFLWQPGGTMTDLGTLSGYPSTVAAAINDLGLVVGTAFDANGHPTAFIWKEGQIYDLNTLISPGSGWTLQNATGINNAGHVVGSGIHSGNPGGFLTKVYTLVTSVSPSGAGTIQADPNAAFYDPNANVTLTARANPGYVFSSWSGDASGSSNPTTIKLTSSKSVTANFTELRYTLTLRYDNEAWGTVQVEPNLPSYPGGTPVRLTAVPIEGKSFKEWRVYEPNHPWDENYATVETNTVLDLTMDANQYVKATFKCGTGMEQVLPLMGLALGAGALTVRASRRRR